MRKKCPVAGLSQVVALMDADGHFLQRDVIEILQLEFSRCDVALMAKAVAGHHLQLHIHDKSSQPFNEEKMRMRVCTLYATMLMPSSISGVWHGRYMAI